eukprot:GEMP01014323.1.p1 GENE.GEMP01014323.1~~GEMP01014323.1.p1  ORF type:complete len:734 (+),score=185.53 GEMP01014323.1:245-2203(+)
MPTRSFLLKQIESLRCTDASEPLHPHELTWFPGGLAWQWNGIDRRAVKKKAEYKELKQWFTAREKHGAISRQETVSMIPALFLDIQSHHLVMDLCAAPGSKTCQMIESMHRMDSNTGQRHSLNWVEGAIFANDVEAKRANMLAHQIQRLGSPCVGVINIDATFFPKLMKDSEQILFDRVLCDVPCTGDGTVRKQPHIWRTWDVKGGLGLHVRQLDILKRGLEMLEVGGRLVYSTCSFNPIENEAVIASMLSRFENIKLLEAPTHVPVKSTPAMKTWRVPKPDGKGTEFYDTYADVPEQWRKLVVPTMFPDGSTDHLLCRRFAPHLMNTGGFFCAIFTKTDSVALIKRTHKASKDVTETPAALDTKDGPAPVETKDDSAPVPQHPAPELRKNWFKQGSEYVMMKEDSEEWQNIQSFYGLHSWARECIFVNKQSSDKKLYAINKGIQRLLRSEGKMQLKFVTAGIRVLQHVDKMGFSCNFRLAQEGIDAMFAMGLSRRVVTAGSLDFMHKLLSKREVSTEEAKQQCGDWEQICADGKIEGGSAVVFMPEGTFKGLAVHVMMSQKMMTLYVDKQEAAALAQSVAQSDNLKGIIDAAAALAAEEAAAAEAEAGEGADVKMDDAPPAPTTETPSGATPDGRTSSGDVTVGDEPTGGN